MTFFSVAFGGIPAALASTSRGGRWAGFLVGLLRRQRSCESFLMMISAL
jgi:hypothetical protein